MAFTHRVTKNKQNKRQVSHAGQERWDVTKVKTVYKTKYRNWGCWYYLLCKVSIPALRRSRGTGHKYRWTTALCFESSILLDLCNPTVAGTAPLHSSLNPNKLKLFLKLWKRYTLLVISYLPILVAGTGGFTFMASTTLGGGGGGGGWGGSFLASPAAASGGEGQSHPFDRTFLTNSSVSAVDPPRARKSPRTANTLFCFEINIFQTLSMNLGRGYYWNESSWVARGLHLYTTSPVHPRVAAVVWVNWIAWSIWID